MEITQEEEKNNSPEIVKDGGTHSTLRPLNVTDFPMCNNADNDWYISVMLFTLNDGNTTTCFLSMSLFGASSVLMNLNEYVQT